MNKEKIAECLDHIAGCVDSSNFSYFNEAVGELTEHTLRDREMMRDMNDAIQKLLNCDATRDYSGVLGVLNQIWFYVNRME